MQMNKLGKRAIVFAENIGLIIIAIATVIAVAIEINSMVSAKTVTLADLLLLFIYLEVLAMVAIYLESGKLPVRMPLYIAIVALARYLILDMKNMDVWHMLAVSGAILIIAIAILVHRYGHNKFPYTDEDSG
jgi:protein PsiE